LAQERHAYTDQDRPRPPGSVVHQSSAPEVPSISVIVRSSSHDSERPLPATPVDTSPPLPPPETKGIPLFDNALPAIRTSASQMFPTSRDDIRSKSPYSVDSNHSTATKQKQRASNIAFPGYTKCDERTTTTRPLGLALRTDALQHQVSLRSNSGDSILDSYGDTKTPAMTVNNQGPPSTKELSATKKLQEASSTTAQLLPEASFAPFSPASQYTAALDSDGPLTELLRDHVAKNHSQTARLGEQLCSLQGQLQETFGQISALVSTIPLLEGASSMIKDIDQRTNSQGDEMREMRNKLREVDESVRQHMASASAHIGITDLARLLEDLQHRLTSEFPRITKTLEEIQSTQNVSRKSSSFRDGSPITTLKNLGPLCLDSDGVFGREPSSEAGSPTSMDIVLSRVDAKLDELFSLRRDYGGKGHGGNSQAEERISEFEQATQEVKLAHQDHPSL
jgi:hypothetical protein